MISKVWGVIRDHCKAPRGIFHALEGANRKGGAFSIRVRRY